VILYAVVDAQLDEIVEFFASPADAERFIAECVGDEPGWSVMLSAEPIEFERQ
jgi:hypothetical protein